MGLGYVAIAQWKTKFCIRMYKNETDFEMCLLLGEVTLIYDGKIVYFLIVMHFWVDFAHYRNDTAEFINKINCFYSFTLSFFHRNTI